MSKLLKAILIGAYGAIIIQLIRILYNDKHETVIELNYVFRKPGILKKIQREIKKNTGNVTTTFTDYTPPKRFPTDLKYVLKYTNAFSHYSSSIYRNGQGVFVEMKCPHSNCYLTNDRSMLLDIRNFDAILFDVENTWDLPPVYRSIHQKYIFTASESSDNYPMCHPLYDEYFNLTWSYRLDSDIRWSYLTIVDKNDTVLGPKINMTWIEAMDPTPFPLRKILGKKKKIAAWFVSNCNSKSERMQITNKIQEYLSNYGFEVDIFGMCGSKSCARDRMEDCLDLLEKEYYFYFAFENSKCEDYVTEKLLHAVQHYTVPVVFGGANYSRFLPPGSYIDAGELQPHAVASLMMESVNNKDKYYDFFRWHNHYAYKEASEESDVCTLCRILNERPYSTVVKNFRHWWNRDFRNQCHKDMMERNITDLDTQKFTVHPIDKLAL